MVDYKTRLTADTSQHDQAINKSAQQVYQYKKRTEDAKNGIFNLHNSIKTASITLLKFNGYFAAGKGAIEFFKRTLNATEQGSDAFEKSIFSAKVATDHFFMSLNTGSFDSFLGGLKDIIKEAGEAYEALDNLGTHNMWKQARINEANATIAKNRVIINNPTVSEDAKKQAQQAIKEAQAVINGFTTELSSAARSAAKEVFEGMAGMSFSDADVEKYRKMWEEGTLEAFIKKLKAENYHEEKRTRERHLPNGIKNREKYTAKWWDGGEEQERLYNALNNLLTHREEGTTISWQMFYDLLNRANQLEEQQANKAIRANSAANKPLTSGTPKVKVEKVEEIIPEGSIAELEKKIKDLKEQYRLAVTDESRAALKSEIEKLQSELDKMEGKIEVKVVEKQAAEGSIAYLREKISNLQKQYEETPDGEIRLQLKLEIDNIQAQLQDALLTPAEKAAKQYEEYMQKISQETENLNSVFNSIGSCYSSLSELFDDETARMIQGFGSIVQQIGQTIPQIMALIAAQEGEALASGTASAAKMPYPANIGAIASIVAQIMGVIGTIATISRFADGGIVGGGRGIGDLNIARVNSGEMILNNTQQHRLFNLLNSNSTALDNESMGGNVTFTIRGADLMGTLDNYNKRRNRVL